MNENELYNTDFIQEYRQEVKLKKKRKNRLLIILMFILTVFCIYLVTPFSKIKSVNVSGESMYTDDQVIEKIQLYPNEISILNPSFMIEYNLNNTGMFKNVKVSKDLNNNVYIKVEENRLLLVEQLNGKYVFYDENNNIVEIALKDQPIYLSSTPFLTETLSIENRAKLIKALKDAEPLVVSQISEVKSLNKQYDDTFRFTMNGNKRIYIETDLTKLQQLSQGYSKILAGTTNNCSLVKIVSNRAVVSKC